MYDTQTHFCNSHFNDPPNTSHVHTRIQVCTCIYTHAHTYKHTQAHAHTYTHIYTHTHTHSHIHTPQALRAAATSGAECLYPTSLIESVCSSSGRSYGSSSGGAGDGYGSGGDSGRKGGGGRGKENTGTCTSAQVCNSFCFTFVQRKSSPKREIVIKQ